GIHRAGHRHIADPAWRRSRTRGPESVPPDVRVTVWGTTHDRNRAARELLTQEGYRHVRVSNRMLIDMDGLPPAPFVPDGIIIRPFVPGQDERATYEAHEEAFADLWGHTPLTFEEWVYYKITREDHFDPGLWFLA